ncbi:MULTISPECIES: aldehyde dehydrogenase family protein [unclassified Methylobacterium]|jgi:succinate-semialdehyde dehydrogenase / glutarate-semialdehyde dehydrogenase|uniref:aldehyde dehydrogenase family protein n=1 Tax=unclassified Methylobacterium TaxID=2615210 RepID=UPI001355F591|nr:aldehyde dehydrogenase family protein [Methylobacterium sp. 2A]MWV24983.1 aldehyde dehydrogenase family protein [Methylobacterium sp. 2A]
MPRALIAHLPQAVCRLATDPRLRRLSFTAGLAAGKEPTALCAGLMKRMVKDLAGHRLVMADTDAEAMAASAVTAPYRNTGQVCLSPACFLVEASAYDRFARVFQAAARTIAVGEAFDAGTQRGPLRNGRRAAIGAPVEEARAHGTVVEGSAPSGPGSWHASAVLTGLAPAARGGDAEPFGPVALIEPVMDLEAAITEANRLSFGLAAYASTGSPRRPSRYPTMGL